MTNAASIAQRDAANPAHSVWLSANAGSGKTRVLTDRVARLLVQGTDPQNILCLTYTKAAAAEMQNRLFERLGKWAMLADSPLADDLTVLGVNGPLNAAALARARTLFAQAMEVPGGLRIQTIHAFCAGLLRRFPLEAGLGPGFQEMEEVQARDLRTAITDDLAGGPDGGAFDGLAEHYTGGELDRFLSEIAGQADRLTPPADEPALRRALGLPADLTMARIVDSVLTADALDTVASVIPILAGGSVNDTKAADRLRPLLTGLSGPAALELLEAVMLYKGGETPGAVKRDFPTKATRAKLANRIGPLHELAERVRDARPLRLGLLALNRSLALHRFAAQWLPRWQAAKDALGLVGFDDLIARARALLTDRSVAQWVLFRLDGGLDHILVDEAQDTSPPQWAVIERLTQEFAAGQGARPDRQRTIFVVGDRKQSIYSFQGADPAAFDQMQHHFRGELDRIGKPLAARELNYSFRSSPAILRAVDMTFTDPAHRGLGQPPFHQAFHDRMPGRVDLWPAVPERERDTDTGDWTDPVDRVAEDHHNVTLSRAMAGRIRAMLDHDLIPERGQDGWHMRRLEPRDFLILVRRRSGLFPLLIAALKNARLPVAGADQLKLGSELAVRDIGALLHFLALPDDDLSLAAALRSPLLGWSEDRLYRLAQPRPVGQTLWEALRKAGDRNPETLTTLNDLRSKADFLRPYDLINRILLRHDGRRRLLARLGAEAEDGIDEMLAQALAHERGQVPDLTGFLAALQTNDIAVKRPLDASQNLIRVMTVHGAKGLESPVVILPDTAVRRASGHGPQLLPGEPVLWTTSKDDAPPAIATRIAERDERDEDERRRLLYVAMTRAEKWLIVAAAGKVGVGEESWHAMAESGLRLAGAVRHETAPELGIGPGLRVQHGDWTGPAVAAVPTAPPVAMPPADWPPLDGPPPRPTGARSPSDLGGAKVLPGETDDSQTESALARGRLVHALLEHLPPLPPDDRPAAARQLAAAVEGAADLPDPGPVIADVLAMLDSPTRGHLFTQGQPEVTLTAAIPALGGARLTGTIDRLIVTDDAVTVIDYKTNRLAPETAETVPEGILRQMGAYHAMVEQLFPGRPIRLVILWTATSGLMAVPVQLCIAALRRVAS